MKSRSTAKYDPITQIENYTQRREKIVNESILVTILFAMLGLSSTALLIVMKLNEGGINNAQALSYFIIGTLLSTFLGRGAGLVYSFIRAFREF